MDESKLLHEDILNLKENRFQGNIGSKMLQNLTKELEFFRREENKEELHEILNIYNSKRHPVIPYQVDYMIISASCTWCNIILDKKYDNTSIYSIKYRRV